MTIEVKGKELIFDFTPKTAIRLEAEVNKWYGSVQNYVNSGVAYDFALWCALVPDADGKKVDFVEFEEIAEEIAEQEYKKLMVELTDVMGFFINIAMRNLNLTKEQKQQMRSMWLQPFEKLKESASAS